MLELQRRTNWQSVLTKTRDRGRMVGTSSVAGGSDSDPPSRTLGVDLAIGPCAPVDRARRVEAMAPELHRICRLQFPVTAMALDAVPGLNPARCATGFRPSTSKPSAECSGASCSTTRSCMTSSSSSATEDFYRDAHQVIYAAIRDLYDKSKGIDAVTLAEELKLRDQFEQVGGDDTLTEIVTSVPHAANGKYYAEIVKQKATNRQLIESATEIIRDGYSNQFTAQELLESAERKIFSIAEDQIRGETLELKDVVKQAMDLIAIRADSGGHAVTGVAYGTDRP